VLITFAGGLEGREDIKREIYMGKARCYYNYLEYM